MSEGNDTPVIAAARKAESNGHLPVASAADLADKTRFKFREQTLEIPELGMSIVLKSLSVREREELPNEIELKETDDSGERTRKAMEAAARVFSVVVAEPKVTFEQALEFLGEWPAEAYDRVTAAYVKMVGNQEEAAAAAAEFPEGS